MHKIIEIFADRAALHTEILALRQQVAVLKRKRPRPLLRKTDRVFWVILSCLWPGWRHALVIVRPETVIGWHRKAFRLFWTWKSRRGKPGRPPVSREIRDLVRRMSRENTRWGAPRIHGELLKLGFSISQAAVSKYMVRYPSPPSQSWRTFLTNHADCLASIDFFVVPTATFHLLFGFIVLHHERRQIVHFGVTANPTMAWVAQQIREAFPWGTAPRYLIRDRDGAYGQSFRSTVTAMGVEEVVTAPRSPWQNPYVERLIGSVRRECLDHSIILNERHLRRILGSYLDYYHGSRTHLSIGKDTPDGRPVHAPPGELIDHGEHAELPPIVCSIHDEVIGPDVIGPARPQTDAGSVVEPQPAPFRLLLWDLQPLPPPDALDPLGVHVPTFGPEQGSDPPMAISAILAGQADDRGRECLFIIPATGSLALG